jgi:hypothetical protein
LPPPGGGGGGAPGPFAQIAEDVTFEAEVAANDDAIFLSPIAPVNTNKANATTVRHLDISPPSGKLTRKDYM